MSIFDNSHSKLIFESFSDESTRNASADTTKKAIFIGMFKVTSFSGKTKEKIINIIDKKIIFYAVLIYCFFV